MEQAKPEAARVERVGPEHIEIRRGEATVEIRGFAAERVAGVWEHMLTHGDAWARTYIMGVIDGLSAAHAERIREIMESASARIAEHRRIMDDIPRQGMGRDAEQ